MAETGEGAKIRKLNFIFKSLGERGKEGEKWKEYTENIVLNILRGLSELLNKTTKKRVKFRLYGSAAEDLKCVEPDNVGDADILIFSNSDNLTIHEEMIEYSPANPLHVKIKGVGYPVLHSCLVEGTGYVATSALKNFHPAIYGDSATLLAELVTRGLQQTKFRDQVSPILQSTCCFKNNAHSPAVTLNFSQSLKDPQELPNVYAAQWEWLIHHLCLVTRVVDTREQADILNVFSQFANELVMSVNNKGLSCVSKVFSVRDFCCSGRGRNLRARFREIERRLRIKRGKRCPINNSTEVAVQENRQPSVTPRNFCKEESARRESQGSLGSIKGSCFVSGKSNDDQRFGEKLEATSSQSITRNPLGNSNRFSGEQVESNIGAEIREDVNDAGKEKQDEDIYKGQSKLIAQQKHNFDARDAEKRELEKCVQSRLFDHLYQTVRDTKGDSSMETKTKDAHIVKPRQQVGGIDFVPAFRSPGWPKVAMDWIKRDRKWPSPEVIGKVIQEGFHLVVKPPKNSGNPDCDFRISFSHAEYLLSQQLNGIQRDCYRCLKKYNRAYLSTEPKGLVTFHLKNIFLQTIEETGADVWTEGNRAECMMKLFGNLLAALTKRDLRHFFVRSYNLFGVDYIENPEILEALARKVGQIMENPMQFARKLIQNQESKEIREAKKEERVPSGEITPCTTTPATALQENVGDSTESVGRRNSLFPSSWYQPAGSGTQFVRRFFSRLESKPAHPQKTDMNDIPLD